MNLRGPGDDLCLCLPAAFWTEQESVFSCQHCFPPVVRIGGTGQTRTDTPDSSDERISNPLQYLLCLLFRICSPKPPHAAGTHLYAAPHFVCFSSVAEGAGFEPTRPHH